MAPALEVRQLSYRYPDGTQALEGITFELGENERLAIIGPNGAGKSTLFFHLNGTLRGQGEIHVFGKKLEPASLQFVRETVGLVFQDPNDQLFMPTVFEDVAFGPSNLGCSETEIRDRVQSALAQVGMEGSEALTPHHLSMGQRKKVALAAVLAMAPKILAFDEPSSALDPRSRRKLIAYLKSLSQPQIIATHDLDLVLDVCHRAILLDEGRVIAEGKIPEIFDRHELLEAHGLDKPLRMQPLQT